MKYSIKEARIKSQLTCCQMAEKLGLSEKTTSNMSNMKKFSAWNKHTIFQKLLKLLWNKLHLFRKNR